MEHKCKKGFVVYFDQLDCVSGLSSAQCGELFRALSDYAAHESKEHVSPMEALSGYPALGDEACVAFLFMGSAIARDTERWHNAVERRRKAAAERKAAGAAKDKNDWMDAFI